MAQKSSDITGTTDVDETRLTSDAVGDDEVGTTLETASDDDASGETENIRAQIEETRAGLGETIDAIQERLSLSNISEQVSEQVNNAIETAKDSVYEATIGKAVHFMKTTGKEISGSSIVGAAKENPLPFVLIGLGAGLLAYQSFSRSSSDRSRTMSSRGTGYKRPQQLTSGSRRDRGSSLMQTAQGGIRNVKDSVSDAAGSAIDGVSRAANSAYDGVTRAAESTYAGAGDLAGRAIDKASDLGTMAQEKYSQYLEEKPWAIGVVALAAGAAIGMAIPSTRYEGELMGEARINLMNKVQDSATDLVDKAKQMATDAGRNVIDEAKSMADETLG